MGLHHSINPYIILPISNQIPFPAYLTTYWSFEEFTRLYGPLTRCNKYGKRSHPNEVYFKCIFENKAGSTEAFLSSKLQYRTLREMLADSHNLKVGMFADTNNFVIFNSSWPVRIMYDASFIELLSRKNGGNII